MKKFKLLLKIFLTGGVVIVFPNIISFILLRITILEGLTKSITEINISDIYYSKGYSLIHEPDPNIVLVNIVILPRRGIAEQLKIINRYNPKVVGIDIFFRSLKEDSIGDALLKQSLDNTKNLVMASHFEHTEKEPILKDKEVDSWFSSHNYFTSNASLGYANINVELEDNLLGIARYFNHSTFIDNEIHFPFGVVISSYYDSTAFKRYIRRSSEQEYLNLRGNYINPLNIDRLKHDRFLALDVFDVLDEKFEPEMIEGKIVIMGFLGQDFEDSSSLENRFYTPLNEDFPKRVKEDMYGTVLHANIVSMILDDDMIYFKDWINYLVNFIVLISSIYFFYWVYNRTGRRYQLFSKISLIVILNLIVFISLIIFHFFQFMIDPRYLLLYLIFGPDTIEILESTGLYKVLRLN